MLFLGGQGRRSPGSQYAVVNNIRLSNGVLDIIPTTFQGSSDGVRVQLDAYQVNRFNFSQDIPSNVASKSYFEYPLEIWSMAEEDINGAINTVYPGPPVVVDPPLDVRVTLMRGRQTSVPVKLNNGSLSWDSTNQVVFDRAAFEADNYDPAQLRIQGVFTDMIAFDISSMAAGSRPTLVNGNPATMVMFSGDLIGASAGFGSIGTFNFFGSTFIEEGTITQPVNLGGNVAPGSYNAYEPDPSVIPPATGFVQFLQGPWRAHTEVLTNMASQNALVIPATNPGGIHQVVLFNRAGNGTISALWHGTVTFNAQLTGGTITVWSVDQLDNQTQASAATGTLSNLRASQGLPIDGDYTFTSTPAGFPFATSGSFAVYR